MGFDAALFAGTDDTLKKVTGPFAYVASGLRHLTDRPMQLRVTTDGATQNFRAASVLAGNVGTLQAGVELMPDARPDDGALDVAILEPDGLMGWLQMAGQILTRRRRSSDRLKRFRADHLELRVSRPRPWQLDGDPMGTASKLTVSIEPGALLVRVPRSTQ
jgi:diacylglycerol kinase family enzyme